MKNLLSFEGKRVLVCGCFSGMGEAAARIVGGLGGEVVGVDVRKPALPLAEFHEVDLRDPAAIDAMVAEVTRRPLDRMLYCAGLPGTKPVVDVMGVNFIGLKYTVEQVAPRLTPGGAIAVVSSAAGMAYQMQMDKVVPFVSIDDPAEARAWVEEHEGEFEQYTFSKMSTILYTLRRGPVLTQDTGVRLNCISPGPTDTPMMPAFVEATSQDFMDRYPKPIGRNSTADEQGWVLAFLVSDAASYVSGENVYTDGGASAGMMNGTIAPPSFG